MTATQDLVDRQPSLRLPGEEPTPAKAELVYRPPSLRLTRALLSLLGFWLLAPIVFFIPPHLPWALAAFLAGIFFAYRNWSGAFEVRAFEGTCPRCGNTLEIEPGSRIAVPHKVVCYACHHEPHLHL